MHATAALSAAALRLVRLQMDVPVSKASSCSEPYCCSSFRGLSLSCAGVGDIYTAMAALYDPTPDKLFEDPAHWTAATSYDCLTAEYAAVGCHGCTHVSVVLHQSADDQKDTGIQVSPPSTVMAAELKTWAANEVSVAVSQE